MSQISDKQLEANQKNAQLGGVKTEEGKAISRYNAIKHGLLCSSILLEVENEEELLEVSKKFRSYYKPANELENILLDRAISCLWRIKRAITAEKEYINEEMKETGWNGRIKSLGTVIHIDLINHDTLTKYQRYETSLERSMLKALHELERMQAKRNGENVPLPGVFDVNISNEK